MERKLLVPRSYWTWMKSLKIQSNTLEGENKRGEEKEKSGKEWNEEEEKGSIKSGRQRRERLKGGRE